MPACQPSHSSCQLPPAASFLNFTDGSHRVQDGALGVLPEHCLPASSFSRPPRRKWPHCIYQPHHNFRLSWPSCIFPREWKVLEGTHHFWVFTFAFSYFLNEWMNKRKHKVAVRKADLGKLKSGLQRHLPRTKDLVQFVLERQSRNNRLCLSLYF